MSKDNDEGIPLDDYGIQNDKVIEISNFVVDILHERTVGSEDADSLTIDDISQIMNALVSSWSIVQDILELEDTIRRQREDPEDFI